jgi:hypothetical protein
VEPILKGKVETQEEVESEVPEGAGEKKEDSHTAVCSRGEPHVFSTDADYKLIFYWQAKARKIKNYTRGMENKKC